MRIHRIKVDMALGEQQTSAHDIIDCALAEARRRGASAADALLFESDALAARVRGCEIDFVKQAREHSLGVRVFMPGPSGLRCAVASTRDLSRSAVESTAEAASALAGATAEDPAAGLPDGDFASDEPNLALSAPEDRGVTVEARIEDARRAEAAARAVDPRIQNSEGSEVNSSFLKVSYSNSKGFFGSYETASHVTSCVPIACQNGRMQIEYWSAVARRLSHLEDAAQIGRVAAERALRRLGARRVPTCTVPVIFEARVARSLLGHLASCLSGSAIYRGLSFLTGRLGETIASPAVTVLDDGRLPGGLGSRPFDGEGLPTRRTVVMEKGKLSSYLLDTYSARKLGLRSTGNATRGMGGSPSAGASNLWLEPGTPALSELVASTPRGLLVTWLFGQGFNPTTGDFSRGAAGLWIENGEIAFPVEEITVAGNFGDMLRDIDAVGNDLLWLGAAAAPSFRVARMTVAGE